MSSTETLDAIAESHSPIDESQSADSTHDQTMSVGDIRDAYERYAKWIDRFGWLNQLVTGRYRRRQFSQADGRVLDVACGTGTNFQCLPESVELVGIDISEAMLSRADAEIDRLGLCGTVEQMDAQALDYDADSFDTVISSFSTCTFPNPVAALKEMRRVCKPDGQILLVEHGRSDVDFLARYQEWRADAHYEKSGCRLTHEPLEVVGKAGLNVDSAETWQLDRITTISCENPRYSTEERDR